MKAIHLIRYSLLTGVCAGLLTGCSWLEDWPPKGSELARKSAPKPPQSRVVEGTDSTWLSDQNAEEDEQASLSGAKGIAMDKGSEQRIASLEKSLDEIRNDLKLMMPALTKLASAQGDLQKNLAGVEPAAGAAMSPNLAPPNDNIPPGFRNNQQAAMKKAPPSEPQPGSVAWYEQQEKEKRRSQRRAEWQQKQSQQTANAQAQGQPPAYQQQGSYGQQTAHYQPQQPPAYQGGGQYQQPSAYGQGAYQQQPPAYQPPAQQYQPPPPAYGQPASIQPAAGGYTNVGYGGGFGPSVTNVRFGEHSDKTRLVLDTSDKVNFGYNIDNNARVLVINLPGTNWQTANEMMVYNSPLVASYRITPDNAGGHQVVMQLKRPAQVLWAQALTPGGPQGHRVVVDIAPL